MDNSKHIKEADIGRLLWQFSLPAITGMLVNALYNMVDRIFVGRIVGSLAIAALNVCFPVIIILMAFSMLIGMGAAALVSIRLGQGKKDEAELIAGNALVLLVFISLALAAVLFNFLEPLLAVFGASREVMPLALSYMRIILFGNVFMSVGFGLNNIIRAEGNPIIAMSTMIIGAVANVILDYIAVYPLGMGVQGAALATIISQFVVTVFVLNYFLSGKSLVKLRLQNLRVKPATGLAVCWAGVPLFAIQLVNSVQQMILNNSLGLYGGDLAIAAGGVIFSLASVTFMLLIGISHGAQPIIGVNYGAGQHQRVKKAFKLASVWATVISITGFVIVLLFTDQLVGLFSRNDIQLNQLAAHALVVSFFMFPLVGFQIVGSGFFQAIGKPVQATILSLSRQILLYIPLLLILPRFWGLEGIWRSSPVADLGSALITVVFVYYQVRRMDQATVNPGA